MSYVLVSMTHERALGPFLTRKLAEDYRDCRGIPAGEHGYVAVPITDPLPDLDLQPPATVRIEQVKRALFGEGRHRA